MPPKGKRHHDVSMESASAIWKASLRIDRNYFANFGSCGQNADWFDPILNSVRQKFTTLCGDEDHLDILETTVLEESLRRRLYQFKSSKGLDVVVNNNADIAIGVVFSSKREGHLQSIPSPETLSVLLSQAIESNSEKDHHPKDQVIDHMIGYMHDLGADAQYGRKRDLSMHIGHHLLSWKRERNPLHRWPYPAFNTRAFLIQRKPIRLSFNFRYMTLAQDGDIKDERLETGSIPAVMPGRARTYIHEKRHMLMMRMFPAEDCSRFTMLSIGDLAPGVAPRILESQLTGPFTPLVLFIKHLRGLIVAYTAEWYAILAQVGKEVDFTITDLEDPSHIDHLMRDRQDLHISKTYFKIFQLLRTFSSMIEETHSDFRDWQFKIKATFENRPADERQHAAVEQEIEKLYKQWDTWHGKLNGRFGEMRQRFKDKQADLTSLTASLHDTTAVREAFESTQQARESNKLNRYVLTFTVVTVVYLPLTFVTAIFSMNNVPDDSPFYQSMNPFGWTLLALSLSTYAIAGFSIFFYKRSDAGLEKR